MESQQLKEIAKIQKQYHQDLESVRNEERKLCNLEMERLKNNYLSKQREMNNQMMKAEQTHQHRVQSLEDQLLQSSNQQQELSSRIKVYEEENHRLVDEIKRLSHLHVDKVNSLKHHIEKLSQAIDQAKEQEIEAKNQELSYQEQHESVIKANHLMKIQLHEAKRQVSERHALAEQWRKAVEEIEHSHGAKETSLKIAQEEIMMLEHELKRMVDEKALLTQQLEHCHRLIYGVSSKHPLPNPPAAARGVAKDTTYLSAISSSSILASPYTAKRSLMMATSSASANQSVSSIKTEAKKTIAVASTGRKKKENRSNNLSMSSAASRSQLTTPSPLTESSFNSGRNHSMMTVTMDRSWRSLDRDRSSTILTR
jgi:hypothetical protein